MPKIVKKKLTTVERAILARDRHLTRMEKDIRTIERNAAASIAVIRKRMATVRVLRDALVKGDLKA